MFFCIFQSYSANSQSILQTPLTSENFHLYDKYIKDYAPADSAFNVMMHIANNNQRSRRYAAARQTLVIYGSLFPAKQEQITERLKNNEIFMLCNTPTQDLESFYVQYAKDSANTENGYLAIQRLADNYINRLKFDSAAALYRAYSPLYPDIEKIQKTIDILEAPLDYLEIKNLGPLVNSAAGEWDPNPTPDGRYLYFSTSGRKGSYGGHDVYVSTFEDGNWLEPVNVGPKINKDNINQPPSKKD